MQYTTFDDLMYAARHLQPELQSVLVHTLQVAPPPATPDDADDVMEALREAGAFEVMGELVDTHMPPPSHVVEADLLAAVATMATEWEDDPSL
jgi:hypothetical protein